MNSYPENMLGRNSTEMGQLPNMRRELKYTALVEIYSYPLGEQTFGF